MFLWSSFSFAEDTLMLDVNNDQFSLQGYYYHYEDTSNNMGVDNVLEQSWNKLKGNPTFTSNKYVQWLKYHIGN